MQNQQMAMAGMNANVGGPVDGTPVMGNMPRPANKDAMDPRNLMNTYIYDYFIRNKHYGLAKSMVESEIPINLQGGKPSPNGRNVNGVDAMDENERNSLPDPVLPPGQRVDNSFLMDWWLQFWDIYSANRGRPTKSAQYSQHARSLAQLQNDQRSQRMMMQSNMNQAQYQTMMAARGMPNGVAPNDLKRAAAMNRNPNGANPMANMGQMKNQAMMSAQMQRDGSQMEMNGQRPQSPGSAENAPSPNKRPRVEGTHSSSPRMDAPRIQGMAQLPMGATLHPPANYVLLAGGMNGGNMAGNQFNEFAQAQNVQQKSIEVYAQSLAQQQRIALNNHAMAQGMNPGVQGSPMNSQLDGETAMFAGNAPRPGMPAPGQPQGNHALQDYQMQLMLLEQQNKKRLLMARQEQDSMSAGPHSQPAIGAPGFPPAMSPQGNRAGPSPNPTDQMKRGTPKLNQQVLPGSPMPDQQRNSPAPGMTFDPSQMPPGMPPQFPGYAQMPQNPMMRPPPSSHPGNFNAQQLTPQQVEQMRNGAMQNGMQNGAWRGPGGPQAMMQGAQQMGGPMGNPQRGNPMPPPPAPPAGEQSRTEPSPSQPAAPPTPQQTNKANPKKKVTKDNKKPAKAKGANTGATPAASGEETAPTPTPSTPITPMHKNSFAQNGQQPAQAQAPPQPAAPAQPQPPMDNNGVPPFGTMTDDPALDFGLDGFGAGDALENFDFDSFLHVDDPAGFNLGNDFGLGDGVEAGGEF